MDEYVRIGECMTTQCLQKFVRGINEIFGQEYMRRPNNNLFLDKKNKKREW